MPELSFRPPAQMQYRMVRSKVHKGFLPTACPLADELVATRHLIGGGPCNRAGQHKLVSPHSWSTRGPIREESVRSTLSRCAERAYLRQLRPHEWTLWRTTGTWYDAGSPAHFGLRQKRTVLVKLHRDDCYSGTPRAASASARGSRALNTAERPPTWRRCSGGHP